MIGSIKALQEAVPAFDFLFFASVRQSGERDGIPFIELCNGDVLFGFSDWRATYYRPHFENHGAAFSALNINESAYGAAFDALVSYHCENAWPLLKSVYLPRGAVVLDVGVRAGHWLVKAARQAGPNARIIGVDASEFAESFSERHIRANQLIQATFVRAAIGAEDGARKTFYGGSSGESYSGFHPVTRDASGAETAVAEMHSDCHEVSTRTIDAVVAEIDVPTVDMIVLQINGAEKDALRGASDTLGRFKPILYVTSYHSAQGGGVGDEIGYYLEMFGYAVVNETESCRVYRHR